MALDDDSRHMVDVCRNKTVWFAVHENFRYQPQFLLLKQHLSAGGLGRVLHAHVQLKSPDRRIISVQPTLAAMKHMALRDMGPHIFDIVRYLFGEVTSVLAYPVSSYNDIPVDDSVLALLKTAAGHPVMCTLTHDFRYKAFIAFEKGTFLLDDQNNLTVETAEGRQDYCYPEYQRLPYVPMEDWKIHGGHVFLAISPCLEDLRNAFLEGKPAPTSGEDNLKTMEIVFAAIRSVETGLPQQPGLRAGTSENRHSSWSYPMPSATGIRDTQNRGCREAIGHGSAPWSGGFADR